MLRKPWTIALALLILFIAEVALYTRHQSPSWDEGDHIFSGYMNWKHGEYSLNPEHPPLVKLIATLPLLPLALKVAPRQNRYFKDEAYFGGHDLLYGNAPAYSADTLLFRVHMASLVFGVTLGLLLFLAGSEMFGPAAGLIALALFVFDPTILTNAPFVTTDTGAACGYFATAYTFYRFIKQKTWLRALVCGVTLGLALTTKHSVLAVVPIVILLALGELIGQFRTNRPAFGQSARQTILGLAAIFTLALVTLWAVYGFHYAMHPSGVQMDSLASQISTLPTTSRVVIGFCARFHLLPESYLYGMADVQRVGIFMPMFLLGQVHAHGVWYYFPVILSAKFTIGLIGLLALTVYALITGKLKRPRELLFLILPATCFLIAAMGAPLNIGVRHVLPLFPFAFALAGAGAAALLQQRRAWGYVIAALLLWNIVDSVRLFPNYMPYTNAFWGGPTKAHDYFSDSAVDWAQNLKYAKQYVDSHNIHQCSFAYFAAPYLLPSDYGIPCTLLPTLDTYGEQDIAVPAIVHGPILVSMGTLNGFEFGSRVRNPYQTLFERQPDAIIANSIAVFNGDFALPEAAALQYEHQADANLKKDPKAALTAAREAVALAPNGFDANLSLGDAQAANHNPAAARAAYTVSATRLADMEPTAQQQWRPIVDQKLASLSQN